MFDDFPPSSPVKLYKSNKINSKNDDLIIDQLNLLSDDHKQIITKTNHEHPNRYPTPNPSSSTGITIPSSPISSSAIIKDKDNIERNIITTSNAFIPQLLSDPPPIEHINPKTPSRTNDHLNGTVSDDILIVINPSISQHYILGRKSSICDIKLPHFKNISRQHAIVSYNDKNKVLHINCLGNNGMIITFQSETDFSLKNMTPKDNNNMKSYKISPCLTKDDKINNTLLKKYNNLISFSLLKNETVELPLIDNTILDFKNCRCVIQLSYYNYHDTDTEDEFVLLPLNSDDFTHTPTKHLVSINPHLDDSPVTEKSSIIIERSSPSILLKTPPPPRQHQQQHQYFQYNEVPYQQEPQTPVKKKYKFNTDMHNNMRRINNMESPIKRSSNKIADEICLPKILKFNTFTRTIADEESSKFKNYLINKPINPIYVTPNIDKKYDSEVDSQNFSSTNKNITNIEKSELLPLQNNIENRSASLTKNINILEFGDIIERNNDIKCSIRHTLEDKINSTEESNTKQYQETKEDSVESDLLSIESKNSHPEVKNCSSSKKKRKLNVQSNEDKEVYLARNLIEKSTIDLKEIQRIIINKIAFSNLKQTPLSHIINTNKTTRLLAKNEIKSLLHDIPCIGEIKRYGKDAAGELLEAEYYYDLENDDDEERRNLMISLNGGRNFGLRSCRKTHKQYYWKKPPKR